MPDGTPTGPEVGERLPDFELTDHPSRICLNVAARRRLRTPGPGTAGFQEGTGRAPCLDTAQARKRSTPRTTWRVRTEWNTSKACCAPGTSA